MGLGKEHQNSIANRRRLVCLKVKLPAYRAGLLLNVIPNLSPEVPLGAVTPKADLPKARLRDPTPARTTSGWQSELGI